MNRLKELNERRGVKLKEADALLNKARDEERDLTTDELKSLDTVQTEIGDIDKNAQAEIRQAALKKAEPVKLSDKEERDIDKFHWGKFLRGVRGNRMQDGIEGEMVAEGESEARASGANTDGVTLPRMFTRREQRDMTATGGTDLNQGGMTIPTLKSGILDAFFNKLIIREAGATVLEGLTGNLDIPRFVAPSDPVKKTENQAAGELSPTSAMLSLSPNRLPGYVEISDQLLMQSSSAIETVVQRNLTAQTLAVAEKAFFHGGGTSEANGIAGTSGIGSVAGGTNGAAPTWAHLVDLETEVAVDNADVGSLHYASNQQIRGKLKQTVKVSSTDSMMLWDDRNNGLINGYNMLTTNAISKTLTKGSSSVASAIFFGNFQDYYIGFWAGLSFKVVEDHTLAKTGLSAIHFTMYYDGGVVRPTSFAAMLDALGA